MSSPGRGMVTCTLGDAHSFCLKFFPTSFVGSESLSRVAEKMQNRSDGLGRGEGSCRVGWGPKELSLVGC